MGLVNSQIDGAEPPKSRFHPSTEAPRTSYEYGLSAAPGPRIRWPGRNAEERLSRAGHVASLAGRQQPGPRNRPHPGPIRRPKAGSALPDARAKVFQVFFKIVLPGHAIRAAKNDKKARQFGLKSLSQACCFSRLTILRAEAYIRPIGALFRKLQLDGAHLKLLTGSVKMPQIVFGSMSFDDAFRCLAGWQVGFSDPGLFDK